MRKHGLLFLSWAAIAAVGLGLGAAMVSRPPVHQVEFLPAAAAQEKPIDESPPPRPTGYKAPTAQQRKAMHTEAVQRHGGRVAMQVKNATFPPKFDCTDQGWVPPIRDQGSCGSCYLVSTMDAITCAFIKAGYAKADDSFKMSDQWGMDCHNFGGCNGGWGAEVVDYVCKNGAPAERYIDATGKTVNDYPAYEARSRTCRLPAGAKMWKPNSWGYATGDQGDRPATVEETKTCLMQYGVLNIALDAGGAFGSYSGNGVVETLGKSINHEITMVGWDDSKGKKGAWKCRNQWGKGYGADGYVWIGYGAYIVETFWVTANQLPPPPPMPVTVTSVAPNPVQSGNQFTITGTNFDATMKVSWSGQALQSTFVGPTQFTAIAPQVLVSAASPIAVDGAGGPSLTVYPSNVPPIPPVPPSPGQATITLAGTNGDDGVYYLVPQQLANMRLIDALLPIPGRAPKAPTPPPCCLPKIEPEPVKPEIKPEPKPEPKPAVKAKAAASYADGMEQAKAADLPLVIFHGVEVVDGPWVAWHVDKDAAGGDVGKFLVGRIVVVAIPPAFESETLTEASDAAITVAIKRLRKK